MNGLGARRILRSEIISILRGRLDSNDYKVISNTSNRYILQKRAVKSARSERDLCKTRLSNARVAKGAENGACGSPAKQFQNLPGMTEPCRTRVDCYTDSPPVRKLWGGILPRSDTSAFPRDASGGFTRCCYLSHCVGRGGERGFCVFVDICRIMSVEGKSTAFAFLSITVALCRSRGCEALAFCR